ncbi:carbohydrate ABC transporter permease [Angustibacter sp. Root456]|uniref:carbohydrate ABC transporter permease n=1 Tax=Angustibacter sp. Root456 TaxID=1736539 RepID=UPI0006F4037B|nr:carbohydrate ABC transporter permease [Angustibacter sp. Root456]KQX63672.1 sugar ABC transporter permease [Angustibacter sp. Root456]
MSTLTPAITPEQTPPPKKARLGATSTARKALTSRVASFVAVIIAVLWTIPTAGLLITSFRAPKDINTSGWWTAFSNPNFTLDNYRAVLGEGTSSLTGAFVNSIVITVPAVLLPILLSTLAAYAFAWMNFKGRDALFVAVFALQVVPLQVALIPLLSLYVKQLHFANTYWSVWISHTIFSLPLAIFLMHNFIKEIPGELIEAARVDGAGHVRIFFRIMLPLLTPALASFGIFQFLWVWNDLLVGLVFLGGTPDVAPITVVLASLSGTRGSAWYLLSAGAFVAMIVPIVVFMALQRFFVRGLLAGGLKG